MHSNESQPTQRRFPLSEELKKVEIKNREKYYFENVFKSLCDLEKEPSSDENSKEKQYLKKIEEKVKLKQMKFEKSTFKSKTLGQDKKKTLPKKKYLEDKEKEEEREKILNLYKDQEKDEEKLRKDKFGKKALRKIMKKLTGSFNKQDIDLMIWEVDADLNGYVTFDEYENMYKRCVIDRKEREPKKLYNLIQFLMFDKDHKGYIIEEDTLEVLTIRNTNGLDNAINDIFMIETKDEKGNIIRTKQRKEEVTYEEFAARMHSLSLRKRTQLMNSKKTFCDKVKEEALMNARLNRDRKGN